MSTPNPNSALREKINDYNKNINFDPTISENTDFQESVNFTKAQDNKENEKKFSSENQGIYLESHGSRKEKSMDVYEKNIFSMQHTKKSVEECSENTLQKLEITSPSFFNLSNNKGKNKKILHFFQPKSKYFHYVDIDRLTTNDNVKNYFTRIYLEIDFLIPRHHRSISTDSGYVFLTGGISIEDKKSTSQQYTAGSYGSKNEGNVLPNCYILNIEKRTLVPISNMNVSRIEHNLCFANEEVYAIGGYSDMFPQKDSITICEKYSPYKREWIKIADCLIPTHNCS